MVSPFHSESDCLQSPENPLCHTQLPPSRQSVPWREEKEERTKWARKKTDGWAIEMIHNEHTLTTLVTTGSIRSHRNPPGEVGSRARSIPPCVLQEHPRDRPGHQWLEARACREVPRERPGAQGGCCHEEVRRRNRSRRPGYVISPPLRGAEILCSREILVMATDVMI